MRFIITHPIHTHPYSPELMTGSAIGAVASAAERAGFYGFGFTDHPAPTQRWLESGGHDALVEDLRRRCDAAGRDHSTIDITFNGLRGTPGTAEFNADTYFSEVERIALPGVSAVQLSVPGDSLAHAVEAIEQFGTSVISTQSGRLI